MSNIADDKASPNLRERFMRWWREPLKPGARLIGAVLGLFGGFWIGLLGVMLAGGPALLGALGGACAGAVVGARWPKVATLVFFPFATFGAS